MAKFVVVSLAALITVQANILQEGSSYQNDCLKLSGCDRGAIENSRHGNFAEDSKFNEFLLCFFKKAGFLNEAGEYNQVGIKEKVAKEYSPDLAEMILSVCCQHKFDSPLMRAHEFAKCYHENTASNIPFHY